MGDRQGRMYPGSIMQSVLWEACISLCHTHLFDGPHSFLRHPKRAAILLILHPERREKREEGMAPCLFDAASRSWLPAKGCYGGVGFLWSLCLLSVTHRCKTCRTSIWMFELMVCVQSTVTEHVQCGCSIASSCQATMHVVSNGCGCADY